ncbi:MAG: hypothetical protein LBR54_00900 [Oscillospiraceae bacterium]|jgi:hypothetical protein|nr:hypothetical protein [Oscillospiraceae bacterium]
MDNSFNDMKNKYKEEMLKTYAKSGSKDVPAAPVQSREEYIKQEFEEIPQKFTSGIEESEGLIIPETEKTQTAPPSNTGNTGNRPNVNNQTAPSSNTGNTGNRPNVNNQNIQSYNAGNTMNDKIEGQGKLVVSVKTAKGSIPVSGAFVIIGRDNGTGREEVIYTLETDQNGLTPLVSLETPTLIPGSETDKSYEKYNITVSADGYFSMQYIDVPVFSNIKAIQNVSLVAMPTVMPPNADTTIVYSENQR